MYEYFMFSSYSHEKEDMICVNKSLSSDIIRINEKRITGTSFITWILGLT